uniref:Uncharacterized protein n=1 Tax=Equus caballus TaxID=9796 RepID=A0A9L0SWW8_HORSE
MPIFLYFICGTLPQHGLTSGVYVYTRDLNQGTPGRQSSACELNHCTTGLALLVDFFVDYIGFALSMTMSSANKDNSTSSFPIWMSLISFTCLIVWTRTFSIMFNRSGESGHLLSFVPDFGGKAFSLSPLSGMIVVGFSWMSFIMLRKFLSLPSLLRDFFIRNGC